MVALVTLDAVKRSLRIEHQDDNTLISTCILSASAIVLKHIKADAEEYTLESVPDDIGQVVTLIAMRIYEHGEGKDYQGKDDDGYFCQTAKALLVGYRTPSLA